ncbi:hypothetical protein HOB30_03535 [Candidatus Falkowbacteria bacterium]|jgi:hypothetical protein|nr:hypothetical protein [Candidatus Falkowbacteria bacterium]
MRIFLSLGSILIVVSLLVLAQDHLGGPNSSETVTIPTVQPCGTCDDIDGVYYKHYTYRIENKWIISESDGKPREVTEVKVVPPETCGQVLHFPQCGDMECQLEFDGVASIQFKMDMIPDTPEIKLINKGQGDLFLYDCFTDQNEHGLIFTGEFLIRHKPANRVGHAPDKSAITETTTNNENQED